MVRFLTLGLFFLEEGRETTTILFHDINTQGCISVSATKCQGRSSALSEKIRRTFPDVLHVYGDKENC